ncbi:MAG TPA: NAD(P)/FAD-dependent oxidoreductase [Pyrinomonadaceae bacterium]
MAREIYDVVIVGGGPAGTCAAIHLAGAGARVVLAEQRSFPRPKLCGEFVSPECLEHFVRLGVLERMEAAGGREVAETVFYARSGRSVSVPSEWFGGSSAEGWRGGAALGLSRAEMDRRLLERAREVGVEVLEETRACGLLSSASGAAGAWVEGVRLKTDDGEVREVREVRARLTIDATGRSRSVARLAERDVRRHRHVGRAKLVAFKAHVEGVERGAEGRCEIYFYGGGYGGLSPVESGRSNLCFIASARDVRACGSDAGRVMREVLWTNRRARWALAGASLRSEWLSVAIENFGRGELVPARGLVAVGDAASFIDPFTGSGMLMALESGELAAEVVGRRLRRLRETDARRDATALDELACEYRARYAERFGARLGVCSWLRRAAFAPSSVIETAVLALGASERVRRALARATRGHGGADFGWRGRKSSARG